MLEDMVSISKIQRILVSRYTNVEKWQKIATLVCQWKKNTVVVGVRKQIAVRFKILVKNCGELGSIIVII